MEVSGRNKEVQGTELITTVAEIAEIPNDWVREELAPWMDAAQGDAGSLTLEQLRIVMLNYLETFQEEFCGEEEVENIAEPKH